jgi:hypothetical protein
MKTQKIRLHSLLLASTAVLAFGVSPVKAQLLTYEGFNYSPNQTLDDLNGGTGWHEAWDSQNNNTQYQVSSTTQLTYGSLQTTGNYTNGGGGFDNTGRRVATSFGSVWDNAGRVSDPWTNQYLDQGVVWGSFLLRRDADVPNWDPLSVAFHRNNTPWNNTSANESLRIQAVGSQFQATSYNNGNFANIATSNLGDTLLFVIKWELSLTAGQNNIYLWVNPNQSTFGGADLHTNTATWSATGLDTDEARWKSFSFHSGHTTSATSLDEIRFGTSYASVTPIPEPSTYALIGLGLAALFTLRRFSSKSS